MPFSQTVPSLMATHIMITSRSIFVFLAALLLAAPDVSAEDEKINLLLRKSPSVANAVGYVNIGSLNELMDGAGIQTKVAENVEEYWFIADLDFMKFRPRWEAGYATLKSSVEPENLAQQVGGYVDQIADQDVVWSPGQTYFVPGKENRLGILRPADRSLLAGWLKPSVSVNYSDFLERNANQSETYLSVLLAIELKDVFSPVPLAKKLEDLKSLKANSPENIAGTLASVEGVSIIVGRKSLNECIVRFQFGKSPAGLKPIAAELLAEVLERNGTAAPEVLTWSVKSDATSLSLQGPITEGTLTGVLGIFSLQSQANRAATAMSDSGRERTKQQQTGYRSKYYFDEIGEIIERTRNHKSQSSGALAKWNDQRARQIDELGTLDVDPEVVQYGTNVAELLRGNALTVRQGNIAAGKIQANQSLSGGGYYGRNSYGDGYYYDTNSTSDYQNVTAAIARGNAYQNYRQALSAIDTLTASVKRAMTEKYQLQF